MHPTVCRALALALSALALAGCGSRTSLPQTQSGDASQPSDFSLLTDIPIPSGATMDNEHSLILGDKDRWTGRAVMRLWKTAAETNQFYQSQMPAFGWEPIMVMTSGVSVMAYVRGDRAATVQIESGTAWGSTVTVTVGQRAMGTNQSSGAYGSGGAATYGDNQVRAQPVEKVRSEPLPARR